LTAWFLAKVADCALAEEAAGAARLAPDQECVAHAGLLLFAAQEKISCLLANFAENACFAAAIRLLPRKKLRILLAPAGIFSRFLR